MSGGPETPPASVERREQGGRVVLRLPSFAAAEGETKGKGTVRGAPSGCSLFGFVAAAFAVDLGVGWCLTGRPVPCDCFLTPLQVLVIAVFHWSDVWQRAAEREIIFEPGWVGFRWAWGVLGWTAWQRLADLTRIEMRHSDYDFDFREHVRVVLGDLHMTFEWFGEWQELRRFAENLAAECVRSGGPAVALVVVDEREET